MRAIRKHPSRPQERSVFCGLSSGRHKGHLTRGNSRIDVSPIRRPRPKGPLRRGGGRCGIRIIYGHVPIVFPTADHVQYSTYTVRAYPKFLYRSERGRFDVIQQQSYALPPLTPVTWDTTITHDVCLTLITTHTHSYVRIPLTGIRLNYWKRRDKIRNYHRKNCFFFYRRAIDNTIYLSVMWYQRDGTTYY